MTQEDLRTQLHATDPSFKRRYEPVIINSLLVSRFRPDFKRTQETSAYSSAKAESFHLVSLLLFLSQGDLLLIQTSKKHDGL
jgi:hypothetical protein